MSREAAGSAGRARSGIRVLVADDHGVVRSGLAMLIERQPDMAVVSEAADGIAAVDAALAERPDVAVLDVSMPGLTGPQAARQIKGHGLGTALLMLSMHEDERYFFEALDAGALGYVPKRAADSDLIDAIRTVASGTTFVSSSTQQTLMRRWLEEDPDARREQLTARELEVVKLIAEAHTNRQIAEALKVSEKTVESHRGNVLAKLGMRDRVELARYAIRRGLVEP
jgi:DNA-binding NarL/FixJ family response regulator